jgi:hypothetical protein
MSQQNDTGFVTLTAGEELAAFRRVKLNGTTSRSVVYADAGEDFIGVTQSAAASGAAVTIKRKFSPGSFKVTVSADTAALNAQLYGANDGKVSTVASGAPQFFGLERGTADGAIIEALLDTDTPAQAANVAAAAAQTQDTLTLTNMTGTAATTPAAEAGRAESSRSATASAKKNWTLPRKASPRWPRVAGARARPASSTMQQWARRRGMARGPSTARSCRRAVEATARAMSATTVADGGARATVARPPAKSRAAPRAAIVRRNGEGTAAASAA